MEKLRIQEDNGRSELNLFPCGEVSLEGFKNILAGLTAVWGDVRKSGAENSEGCTSAQFLHSEVLSSKSGSCWPVEKGQAKVTS